VDIGICLYAAPTEGKWVVRSSLLAGAKPGDVLTQIDHTEMEGFFLQKQRYIPGSSVSARRHNLFLLPYLFPRQLVLTLEDGRQVLITRGSLQDRMEKTDGKWPQPSKVAYIRVASFFDPSFKLRALDYVGQFQKAKTLIIDIRGNSGGFPPERLLEAVMDRPYRRWLQLAEKDACSLIANQKAAPMRSSSPNRPSVPDPVIITQDSTPIQPSHNVFKGRLILLVDGGCVSACEDFVEPLKVSRRATIIGETTQGSAGLRSAVYLRFWKRHEPQDCCHQELLS